MVLKQDPTGGDRVLGLGAVQPDGLDEIGQAFAQRQQGFRRAVLRKNLRVAMLTDLSVACADSGTAISNWNGVSYSVQWWGD